jgi:hypothetical protein
MACGWRPLAQSGGTWSATLFEDPTVSATLFEDPTVKRFLFELSEELAEAIDAALAGRDRNPAEVVDHMIRYKDCDEMPPLPY